ncbi:MAG: twin-arginine translocase TatA/TatE family subunit [Rhizobiales bacterium]|nr:twin-arginine translocase TatA/TatE family subunit [Hyphomicrobiales bacterium]
MFGSIGPWQIIIVALLVVLLFGRGKISEMMGDVAKGINSFKKGLKEDPEKAIDHTPAEKVADTVNDKSKAS